MGLITYKEEQIDPGNLNINDYQYVLNDGIHRANCPGCNAIVSLGKEPKLGAVYRCEQCNAEFRVVNRKV